MRPIQIIPALALLTVLAAGPACAQGLDTGHARPATPSAAGKAPERPPPAAIPGAESRPNEAAPADRAAADLPPTEALFDAINRGDIATVKDAINRGADLDGHNLLGLSPLELSVDLGRNDISFLLLSFRGEGGSGRSGQPVQAQAASPAVKGAHRRAHAAPADSDQPTAEPVGVVARAAAAPARQAPPLFAGNGGAPQPNVGFLGFDPHR